MADEDDRGGSSNVSSAPIDIAPLIMDDIIHKLLILDYVQKFCHVKDIPPFSRIYFAVPAVNAAVQYQHFIALCAWLLNQARRPFPIDKYEDPVTTLNRLVIELKNCGIMTSPDFNTNGGSNVDISPVKLRIGYGELVCKVLSFLADVALVNNGFRFQSPIIRDEGGTEESNIEEDDGLDEDNEEDIHTNGKGSNRITDEIEEENEDVLFTEIVRSTPSNTSNKNSNSKLADEDMDYRQQQMIDENALNQQPLGIMETNVDPVTWRAELERVTPKLNSANLSTSTKVGIGASRGEWRSHLEQTRNAANVITKYLPSSKDTLDKLCTDLNETLELISSREKYINTSLKHLSGEYRTQADRQTELVTSVQNAQNRITNLTNELTSITDVMEDIKTAMEERGSSMTDTSPLIRIKAALANIRNEIKSLDLQIGVCGHVVMQNRISHKAEYRAGTGRPSSMIPSSSTDHLNDNDDD